VWSARWKGTPVAVKVLTGAAQAETVPKAVIEEFIAEINMVSGMRHPNICLFMGACLDPPNRAIVTELCENGSLWDALRSPLASPYQPADGVTRSAWPLDLYDTPNQPPTSFGNSSVSNPPLVPAGTWPWILVKRVASGTARGMCYLHSGNPPVLHRDLKSANILLDESYTAKLADFGLSRLKAVRSSGMTGNCGTVQWMAPEVLCNEDYAGKTSHL
jgi:serine/threonine protein kinase